MRWSLWSTPWLGNSPQKRCLWWTSGSSMNRLVAGKGQVLLALHGGRLAGAGIMAFPGLSDADNLGRELGFASEMLERVVHIESVYVSSGFRGKGLARILTTRNLELASENGRDLALSTVWPGNASSMSFLYALGLTVRKLTGKYGGLDRFIMLRMPGNVELEGPSVLVPCLDLDGHRSQLGAGTDRRRNPGVMPMHDGRNPETWPFPLSIVTSVPDRPANALESLTACRLNRYEITFFLRS